MSESISENDAALWQHYLRAHTEFATAIFHLWSQATNNVEIVRSNLAPETREAALLFATWLSVEEQKELLKEFVYMVAGAYDTKHGYALDIIKSLPREWLISHIEASIEDLLPILDDNDYYQLLGLYAYLDRGLELRLLEHIDKHDDPEIREVSEHYRQTIMK